MGNSNKILLDNTAESHSTPYQKLPKDLVLEVVGVETLEQCMAAELRGCRAAGALRQAGPGRHHPARITHPPGYETRVDSRPSDDSSAWWQLHLHRARARADAQLHNNVANH